MRLCCETSLVSLSHLKPKHLSPYIKLICLYRLKQQRRNMTKQPEVIHFRLNPAIYSDTNQNNPWQWKEGGTRSTRWQMRSAERCWLADAVEVKDSGVLLLLRLLHLLIPIVPGACTVSEPWCSSTDLKQGCDIDVCVRTGIPKDATKSVGILQPDIKLVGQIERTH